MYPLHLQNFMLKEDLELLESETKIYRTETKIYRPVIFNCYPSEVLTYFRGTIYDDSTSVENMIKSNDSDIPVLVIIMKNTDDNSKLIKDIMTDIKNKIVYTFLLKSFRDTIQIDLFRYNKTSIFI